MFIQIRFPHFYNKKEMIWSRYTYQFEKNNRCFLYNSLSNSLAEIPRSLHCAVKKGMHDGETDFLDEETFRQLKAMKVLVENDDDEINKVIYQNSLRRREERRLILTINPTLACNFNCPYCFEPDHPNIYMSEEVEDGIVRFVKSRTNAKAIDVTWFGGEPLLAFDRVKSLSRKLQNLGLAYNGRMITNGYLLSSEVIEELPSLSITSLQITVDGMAALHDSRRCLRSGKPTFERIMKNIDILQTRYPKIGISIRMNVDETNKEDFINFYHYVSAKHYPNAQLSLAFVKDLSDCKSCTNICNREKQVEFVKHVMQNYGIGDALLYPISDRYECSIRNKNSLVIGPEGEVYKCWNDVGDKRKVVGNINGKVFNEALLLRYLVGADPFMDSQCQECLLLPVCGGGCPLSRIRNKYEGARDNVCPLYKENMDDLFFIHALEKISHLQ